MFHPVGQETQVGREVWRMTEFVFSKFTVMCVGWGGDVSQWRPAWIQRAKWCSRLALFWDFMKNSALGGLFDLGSRVRTEGLQGNLQMHLEAGILAMWDWNSQWDGVSCRKVTDSENMTNRKSSWRSLFAQCRWQCHSVPLENSSWGLNVTAKLCEMT